MKRYLCLFLRLSAICILQSAICNAQITGARTGIRNGVLQNNLDAAGFTITGLLSSFFDSVAPAQAGNSGKFLTTNGATASWAFTPANVLVGKTIYVDGTNGNNGTGLRGRLDKPFLTISAAVAVAASGDVIVVGPGTFTETTNIQLPANVSLYGAGRGVTKLVNSTTAIQSGHAILAPGTGSVIAHLTVDGTGLATTAPIGCLSGDTVFTSALIYDCELLGKSDVFYFDKAGATGLAAYDCIASTSATTTATDVIITLASTGTFEFYNCELLSNGTNISTRGVTAGDGTVRVFGGRISATGSSAANRPAVCLGGTLELHHVRIDRASPGNDLVQTGGTLAIENVTRNDGAALSNSGTITQLSRYALRDNNLSDLASVAAARTNLGATTVGGNFFTLGNPGAISFPEIAADNTVSTKTPSQMRTDLSLVIGTDVQAYDAELAALAGLTSAADKLPYFTGSGAAALATFTGAGRALVDDADASAQRATLGLVIGTDVLAPSGNGSGLTSLTAANITNSTTVGRNILNLTNPGAISFLEFAADNTASTKTASQMRTDLSLVIGTDVQAFDAELAALAGLTSAADKLPYFTGSGTAALATFTGAGRALVDAADAAAQRTTLGATTVGGNIFTLANPGAISFLEIAANNTASTKTASQMRSSLSLVPGLNVQGYDANLDTWAAIIPATDIDTFLATPSSANLRLAVPDGTGSGPLVFQNTPTLVTPNLGVALATSVNNQSFKNNYSTSSQAPTATLRTYIIGSKITVPAGKLQIGTMFTWTFDMTKTAAGTAASTFDIAVGTAGTNADTARVSFTKPAGTAAVDTGLVTITATVRGPLSASGIMVGNFQMTHNLSATGHATIPTVVVNTVSSTFDVTVANLFVGLCITSGASDAITIQQVQANAWNL